MPSLRTLLRQPAYATLCILTLTLAVGANLVVFTIVNAIWLRPRPVHDPDRVVMVMGDTSPFGSAENMHFAELGLQWQVRDVPAFELVAGQVMTSGHNSALKPRIALEAAGRPIETLGVTSEYFRVLGLPIQGRDFVLEDDRYGAAPVAIISHRLWKTAFSGRSDIVGARVPASPTPIQIIGVAPPGFSGSRLGEQADLWIPRNLVPFVSSVPRAADGLPAIPEGGASMLAIARLRPGVTPLQAERLIDQYAKRLPTKLTVVPLSQLFGSPDHRTLIINESRVVRLIVAAAALVLLGGCATLMALVFVHYERRRTEFAIRLALGASSGRLARRLACELAWIVVAGAACAGVAATWGLSALPVLNIPNAIDLARVDLGFDWRVVVIGICVTTLTMLVAASLPMRRFTSKGIAAGLISAVATAPLSSLRFRQIMLAAHVAASVAVLAAAAFFVRTVEYGFAQGPGFDVAHTLFLDVEIGTPYDLNAAMKSAGVTRKPGEDFAKVVEQITAKLANERRPIHRQIVEAVTRHAGVEFVAFGRAPVSPESSAWMAQSQTIQTDSQSHIVRIGYARGNKEYLDALGLRLIAGRPLAASDVRDPRMTRTVVITASLAATLWTGESPLGRHFRMSTDHEVVGVVEDFAFGSMRFDPRYVILSAASNENADSSGALQLIVRASDPDTLVVPLSQTIAEIAPKASKINIRTGRDLIAGDIGRERLGAWFFSGFGVVATILGIAGVFGMVAYLAESRRREFGIRAALGATTIRLARMAIAAGLLPVAIGTGVGLVGALWLVKAADSFLLGTRWFEPANYLTAAFIMLVTAALAGLAAAWRIKRIAPSEALRAM